ncbi:hypothetical protein A2524_02010 [Candidatus Wolfebacteria bacterium RIFOXYD12_FULL_48_21]|uniref:Uncharacterized protein n=1 Tax=Candidatus Wolfebacteria bacterium RIFOXYD1_FULL_48_65 TaxID=1802561 RepID=A0A1F8DZN4_9BACT|nr:MAG: hypothetical protein A2610_03980 [Candidatus Wolfebacteria bacterium RIFOXYD1_FULL_48_65]OGM94570.1 MAG: hypothetical protein A2524_02010 [Candidatus Wolfebacteria bacterium RIFOXYD12_FULL_48_21]OGM96543.1 MAG: hypothetical protein A2532_02405 [Candidatus Wolfebacteria bacterium RIFOXYD2_FULL_48_11]
MGKLLEDNLIGAIDRAEKTGDTLLMCMICVTAIEFCGSVLTGKTGYSKTTPDNFKTFLSSKYMPIKYHGLKDILYELLRNGVAHSYIPKGYIHPSVESSGASEHLQCFKNGIFIYAPQFCADVTAGIKELLKDIHAESELKSKYEGVLNILSEDREGIYKKHLTDKSITPSRELIQGDIISDADSEDILGNPELIASHSSTVCVTSTGIVEIENK